MNIVLRNCLAIIVCFVVGSFVNMALILAGPHIIAAPPGVNMNDAKSLSASMHLLEPKHFVFPFLAHAVGTFAGACVAHVIAATRRSRISYVVGALFLAGGVADGFLIPAPAWFIALDFLVAYLPMAWLATRVGRGIRTEMV